MLKCKLTVDETDPNNKVYKLTDSESGKEFTGIVNLSYSKDMHSYGTVTMDVLVSQVSIKTPEATIETDGYKVTKLLDSDGRLVPGVGSVYFSSRVNKESVLEINKILEQC